MKSAAELWRDPRVAAVDIGAPSYPEASNVADSVTGALERLASLMEWDAHDRGPFGAVVPAGTTVLVKPNWVTHANQGPWGIEPLVTHASVINAVVRGAARAEPASIVVGDAPIQGCDFDKLLATTGVANWSTELQALEPRFKGIRDFRRTTCEIRHGVRQETEDRISLDNFVLFDLGAESLLEPITDDTGAFRVTQYNPTEMVRTHAPGRHQYLVAKDVIEADVIINLPKLKTHKKAGVTCALKNLIGINGNKEYLPHHRVGGSGNGGDCYPGTSPAKRALEFAFDQLNSAPSRAGRRAWSAGTEILQRVVRLGGDRFGVEGSWSGNDTIWRTCLDLNRILLYGRRDGSLADLPQRRVLHVVDAVVAGHGDGPLAPQPLPLGLLLAGSSGAAIDWVSAQLLGYIPERIPIAREAFTTFRWPIAPFNCTAVKLIGDFASGPVDGLRSALAALVPITYPVGWLEAVVSKPMLG